MNKYITPEINAIFIATGCLAMKADTSKTDYYHSETDVYLHYTPELQEEPYQAQINLTEVVVVTSDDAVHLPSDCDRPYEVVRLADLTQFLFFRSFSKECLDHRIARQTYINAQDDLDDAHIMHERSSKAYNVARGKFTLACEALQRANDVHILSTAIHFARKPPRFRQVECY